jgi:hypothetical protein
MDLILSLPKDEVILIVKNASPFDKLRVKQKD